MKERARVAVIQTACVHMRIVSCALYNTLQCVMCTVYRLHTDCIQTVVSRVHAVCGVRVNRGGGRRSEETNFHCERAKKRQCNVPKSTERPMQVNTRRLTSGECLETKKRRRLLAGKGCTHNVRCTCATEFRVAFVRSAFLSLADNELFALLPLDRLESMSSMTSRPTSDADPPIARPCKSGPRPWQEVTFLVIRSFLPTL